MFSPANMAIPLVSSAPVSVVVLVAIIISYSLYTVFDSGRRSSKLPPGPPTRLLFGNELEMPRARAHLQFTKWAREYGGIYSLKRYRATTIIITDRKLIKELIDRRSAIYSSRPINSVNRTLTNLEHLALMPYGDRWRRIRRSIHSHLTEARCDKDHRVLIEAEATQMMYDYWKRPEDHMMHPRRFSNSIINCLVYGIRSKSLEDDHVRKLYTVMAKLAPLQEVGATPPVDDFPILQYLPQFLVSNWRTRSEEVGAMMKSLYKDFTGRVEARQRKGIIRDSLMDKVLQEQEKGDDKLTENELLFLGGVLIEGGSDTSSSLLSTLIQALSHFRDVQAKIHAELDKVFGEVKSPNLEDFDKLHYVNMVIKEGQRFRAVVPGGVPHAVIKDDYIDGMLIPKGSTVVLNIWGMHQDPNVWKDPEVFRPERFQDFPQLASAYASSEWDARDHIGYGAGRRICPGIHLAERNLVIGLSKLLWAFEFSHPAGTPSDIDPTTGLTEGFLQMPKDFGLGIKLRSKTRGETILREYEQAQEIFARYDD